MSRLSFLNKRIYKSTMSAIQTICQKNNVDDSHGLIHAVQIALHVQNSLQTISPSQYQITEQQRQDVLLSALLHDIDDHKYFKTINYQNARFILNNNELKLSQERIQRIVKMVDLVSFSKNGNNINENDPGYYYFARYADRIESLGLIGIYRTYLYSLKDGTPFFLPTTPEPQTAQQLQALIQGRDKIYIARGGKSSAVIDHLFQKVLHIKLPQFISNAYLNNLYKQGHQYVVDFILQHSKNGYKDGLEDLLFRVEKLNQQRMKFQEINEVLGL